MIDLDGYDEAFLTTLWGKLLDSLGFELQYEYPQKIFNNVPFVGYHWWIIDKKTKRSVQSFVNGIWKYVVWKDMKKMTRSLLEDVPVFRIISLLNDNYVNNPFFGCSSIEEVLMKKDLQMV